MVGGAPAPALRSGSRRAAALRPGAIREEMAARAESEARFRALFEQAPIGMYRSRPGGQFLSVNPSSPGRSGTARRRSAPPSRPTASRRGRHLAIEASDGGAGMAPEDPGALRDAAAAAASAAG